MSPRAFQTIIVASMGSKDRLELESKVLAAALKQSHARGDSSGVSLAHKQIFLLLRQQQTAEKKDSGEQTPVVRPEREPEVEVPAEVAAASNDESGKKRKRVMPDIVWTEEESPAGAKAEGRSDEDADREVAVAETNGEVVTGSVEETITDASEETGRPAPSEERSIIDFSTSSEDSEADEERPVAKNADFEGVQPNFNAYGILDVEQIASFEEIHRSFLFLVRRILLSLKKAKRKQRKPLLEELQNLWIAHDILSDPVTRTDFDFRVLGLRGAPDVLIHSAPEDKSHSISSRTPLRIGELMQCAGLLEPTELEIAADMHKAMPEMLFGAFLVKQGFISEEDLGQVLTGQRLLKNGNMTVGHYQICMKSWREQRVSIEESAVSEGFVTPQEMERVIVSGQRETVQGVSAYQSGSTTLRSTAPQFNAEEAAKRKFSAGHAVPLWKDQLDWSEPEAIEHYVDDEPDYEHRKQVESSLDIEGITDAVTNKDGKKSLRRLMEGIHSSGEPAASEDLSVSRSLKNVFGQSSDSGPQAPIRADRLAAGTADRPQEQSVAADALAAEQELKTAQAAGSTSGHDAFTAPEASRLEEGHAGESGVDQGDTGGYEVQHQPAETAGYETVHQQAETGGYELMHHQAETGGHQSAHQPEGYHDAAHRQGDTAGFDATDNQDRATASGGMFGEGNTGYGAQEPADQSHIGSESRPTAEVPLPKIVMEERHHPPVEQDDQNVFGEVNYDDEDDAEDDLEPYDVDPEVYQTRSFEAAAPAAEPIVEHYAMTPSSVTETAAIETSESESSMDDLLDFRTSSDIEPPSEIRKVLDEAFHGVRTSEPEIITIHKEEVETPALPIESQFEALPEERSDIESGVFLQLDSHDSFDNENESATDKDTVQQTKSFPVNGGGQGSGAEISLSSSILESLGEDDESDESTSETAAIVAAPGTEAVGNEKSNATSDGLAVDADPISSVTQDPNPGDRRDSDNVATIDDDTVSGASQEVPNSSEETQNPPVQAPLQAPVQAETSDNAVAEKSTDKPTGEMDTVKLTDVSGSFPGIAPLEEAPGARLKSGEWQIVYKLEGSIADAFLLDDSESEMPKMRPRLTEIDSIIPSSIRELAKADTTSSDSEKDADEHGGSSDQNASDKPVIKPVSNNYSRHEKSKGDKKDKGDKSDKGKGKKD
ncbi:MAG: hypothetical protein SGJ27_15230 [Candidatus Melainabacteria bacterium]|nr:hypothetical protein [Candidatus Melainabacteria bacterium]